MLWGRTESTGTTAQGLLVAGEYRRVRRLGVGGMGETWLGVRERARGIEQRVCLKWIREGFTTDPEFRAAFEREAQIVSQLRHSNVVALIDADPVAGLLVLELVDGTDLRAVITAAGGHRLPIDISMFIALELCKALGYTHSRQHRGAPAGILHRDISAANVLISYEGEVKLADFGVAAVMSARGEPHSRTVRGKPPYMSPEQAAGEPLDQRSDLFSLGVLCYEMIAGVRPFDGVRDGGILNTQHRVALGRYSALQTVVPEVPPAIAAIVERLLRPKPEERFGSAYEVLDAIDAALGGIPNRCRQLGHLARAAHPYETIQYDSGEMVSVAPILSESQAPLIRSVFRRRALMAAGVTSLGALSVVALWTPTAPPPPSSTVVQHSSHAPEAPKPDARTANDAGGLAGSGSSVTDATPPTFASVVPSSGGSTAADASTDSQIAPAKPRLVAVKLGAEPPSQFWVDGKLVGWSPLDVRVKPGRHRVAAGAERPELTREVQVEPGKPTSVLMRFPPPR